jgi:hypothetical protein
VREDGTNSRPSESRSHHSASVATPLATADFGTPSEYADSKTATSLKRAEASHLIVHR